MGTLGLLTPAVLLLAASITGTALAIALLTGRQHAEGIADCLFHLYTAPAQTTYSVHTITVIRAQF